MNHSPFYWNSKEKPMADLTDDWWDPAPAVWYGPEPMNKTEYRIMRASKVPTYGSPGFLIQWKVYQTFSTKTTRDTALTSLNKAHPKWRLKAAEGNPYLEALGYGGTSLPKEGINK